MKKLITSVVISLLLIGEVLAGSIANTTVVRVRTDYHGKAMIFFAVDISNHASCVIPTYYTAFAIDTSTAGGKAALSAALTAKATGGKVRAFGLGFCQNYGPSTAEDLSFLEIFP